MGGIRKVAVDTGGTFTDFIYRDENGRLQAFKTDSVPAAPDQAIRSGFGMARLPGSITLLHGTTVATNALLERKLPPVALLVTSGFRDIMAIGRQNRKRLYDLTPPPRTSLVPDRNIIEVDERVHADGRVARRLKKSDMERAWRRLAALKVQAVAVCFLHAYKNPVNEREAQGFLLAKGMPFVCTSAEVLSEYREYERFSTALVNTLLLPIMQKYLLGLESALAGSDIHIMQSSGGIASGREAARLPVRTILSGPAGGVVAVHRLGRLIGRNRLIGFDMGGTSTDVSLIDGEIHFTHNAEIADHPVRLATIDIHTVGAGGGSIARFDSGGILRVGPESVGADPGPVFYGRGDAVSVSDANLVSGRLPSDFFRRPVHREKAQTAVAALARRGGLSPQELIAGILRVVNSNMERAIKKISIERGHDLRDFALVSFGGAGGLHSAYMARELGMREVVVPFHAGVFSALGILACDIVSDHSRSVLLADPGAAELAPHFRSLAAEHLGRFRRANRIRGPVTSLAFLDVRYLGQSYELTVPYTRDWRCAFHDRHEKMYGTKDEGRALEVVNVRLKLVSENREFRLRKAAPAAGRPRPVRRQRVYWDEGWRESDVYHLFGLFPGQCFSGPAVVLAETATTIVPPGFSARVDGYRNLVIRP